MLLSVRLTNVRQNRYWHTHEDREGGRSHDQRSHQPISLPPTLTTILYGKGDMPSELVMSGTASRPLSDEVCVSNIFRVLVSVEASSVSNARRSG